MLEVWLHRKWHLECHEKWEYDDKTKVQKLVGLEAICPDCHRVRHIGRATMEGEAAFNRCLRHLAKVNGWTAQQTQEHVNTAFLDWQARSKHQWTLDLAWLRDAKL